MCILVRTACIYKYCFMHSKILLKMILVYAHWDMWICFHFFFCTCFCFKYVYENGIHTPGGVNPLCGEWLMLSLSLKYVVIFTFFLCNKILNLLKTNSRPLGLSHCHPLIYQNIKRTFQGPSVNRGYLENCPHSYLKLTSIYSFSSFHFVVVLISQTVFSLHFLSSVQPS